MVTLMVLDGPINGRAAIMDNLRSHKDAALCAAIYAAGAHPLDLLPYSPDLSPIENAVSTPCPCA